MTTAQLMRAVTAAGGELYLDDAGTLRCRAPKGGLSPTLQAAIREHKVALVAALTAPILTDEERAAISTWTIEEHVAYLARLSAADLLSYRRALAFDAAALQQLDAQRRQRSGVTDDAA